MTLFALSIRRPVLATVFSLVIVLFGLLAFTQLGVREYPSVDPPFISVSTTWRGANADIIDAQITEPLEERINGIDGIRTLTSTSSDGRSNISVEFELGADLERAANDVRDRVSQAANILPPDADPSQVSKADADSDPIIFINVSSPQRDLLELSEIADLLFKERLQTIPGVARIDIWGEKRYAMRLWLNPQRLAAYGLTPLDIQQALQTANVELPSGSIEGQNVELSVRTMGRLQTVEDFENLVIKRTGDQMVFLKDVARVELGMENLRSVLRRDGVPMVGVVIRPLPGANYIAIVDEVYVRLEDLKRVVPADIEVGIGFDSTTSIRRSISEVRFTILLAMALVVLVIFLFLREWRSTLVPMIVIPIALIGSFAVMYAFGFSINILTLLAMVLAISLVVDDAIIVLENIYAKLEQGLTPVEAGITGTREIFFAVIATSLALVAVLMPLVFLDGLVGQLFQEFGVVLMGAVIISSFVALTLTPMLVVRLSTLRSEPSWLYVKTEPFFKKLVNTYRTALEATLNRPWVAPVIMVVSFPLIILLFTTLPTELAPREDRSEVRLFATGPEGATYEYMDVHMNAILNIIDDVVPEDMREGVISMTSPGFGGGGMNSGFARVMLTPPRERGISQQELAGTLTRRVNELPTAQTNVSQVPTIAVGRRGGNPVQYVLQAPNLEELRAILPEFMSEVMASEIFAYSDVNLRFTKPELRVDIDRARAERVGVSVRSVAQTLQLALSEARLGYFVRNNKQYQVISQVERDMRSETIDLTNLYVRAANGDPVALDGLVHVYESSTPPRLLRYNRFVAATVSAALMPGYTISDGIDEMHRIADQVLPTSFSTSLAGESRDYVESSGSIMFVFMLALLLVFLVLAAQFESFRDPLTILITVPLALVGALFFLWYFNQTLNIFSQIGIVMLVGLVTKNAILIVEFANQRRDDGSSIREAIMDAATARFRPILMTSLSTILGVLPIALALGDGAESRMPMGIAIIGGLLVGTFLTLFVIPSVYPWMTSKERTMVEINEPAKKTRASDISVSVAT